MSAQDINVNVKIDYNMWRGYWFQYKVKLKIKSDYTLLSSILRYNIVPIKNLFGYITSYLLYIQLDLLLHEVNFCLVCHRLYIRIMFLIVMLRII